MIQDYTPAISGSSDDPYVHPTAIVEAGAVLGRGVKVWHFGHVRSGAVLKDWVSLGKDVYVDSGVTIGQYSRIQNSVSIYEGVHLSDWCFVGPHVAFTNDLAPRARKRSWTKTPTFIQDGASLGAGAVVCCGLTIGAFSMIGAGAIVTRHIPAFHLALGNPARVVGGICACGETIHSVGSNLYEEALRPCCIANLEPEFYRCAESALSRLRESSPATVYSAREEVQLNS